MQLIFMGRLRMHAVQCFVVLLVLSFGVLTYCKAVASDVPSFLGLTPGLTSRAAIDLQLEYVGILPDENAHEYLPPPQVKDVERLIIHYFDDSAIVARLDVYLKEPLPAEPLRARFGHRLLSRPRQDAGREEIYYPAMQALIFYSEDGTPATAEDTQVAAIAYLSPRYLADIHLQQFNQLKLKGAISDAKIEAEKAILIAPNYARAYVARGLYLEDMKNYDAALEAYQRAADAELGLASKARALAFMGTLVAWYKKDDKAAEQLFSKGIQIWSLDHVINQSYGWFLWRRGREKEAITLLHRAFELDNFHAEQWLKAAKNHYDKKEYSQAERYYAVLSAWLETEKAAAAGQQVRADTHRFYSYTLGYLNKRAEAIQQNRKALALNPEDFYMLRELGFNLMVTKQYPQALTQLKKAQGMRPQDNWMMILMARIYATMGEQKKALQWLDAGLKAGYKNKKFLQEDRYLEAIRGQRQFKQLIQELE